MPKIELTVAHNLGQEEARDRIARLMADSRAHFAGQITNVIESWNGYVDAFSFEAMGFATNGQLEVQPSQVLIEMHLPWAAYPFKARIEREILTQARQLLG